MHRLITRHPFKSVEGPEGLATGLVLVLPQNALKKRPQNWLKSFRMNNCVVIVLDNLIIIIILQKQWSGAEVNKVLSKWFRINEMRKK
jgi:hypothetical protein